MPMLIRALIAAAIIVAVWKLVLYFLKSYHSATACQGCNGQGWYWGVREKEKCKECNGTGKKRS